jgi:hypothetical protein
MRSKKDKIKSELFNEIYKIKEERGWPWHVAKDKVKYSYPDQWLQDLIDEL